MELQETDEDAYPTSHVRFLGLSRRQSVWLALTGLLTNSFAIVVVVYWIHRARSIFIERHPEYVSTEPPTISRAISDPVAGEPFAFWITITAIVLPFSVSIVALLYLQASRILARYDPKSARFVKILIPFLVLFQLSASVGMVLLSQYRFPDHNAIHMLGSYIFFISDCFWILTASLLCLSISRTFSRRPEITTETLLLAKPSRFRAIFGLIIIFLSISYFAIFLTKDVMLPFGSQLILHSYVYLEATLITAFMLFYTLYLFEYVEIWRQNDRRG